MRTISSHKSRERETEVKDFMTQIESYRKNAVENFEQEDAQLKKEDLEKARQQATIELNRCEVHRAVENKAGIKLDRVIDGAPANAAAFVTATNIEHGNMKAYITESTLDDKQHAIHAGIHEAWHVKSRFSKMEIREELSHEQLTMLKKQTKLNEDDPTFLLEGFNELATIKDIGVDAKCAYNNSEVPAAQKLEHLCLEHTGESLLASYRSADKYGFYQKLRDLADIFLIQQQLAA